MALFGGVATLKAPFPGVRWNRTTGKILARTEGWEALSPALQEKALTMPTWDFLSENGQVWAKQVVEEEGEVETFFLLPAEGYAEALQRLERLEAEVKFLRDQLHAFVQNVPLPLCVVEPSQDRLVFANGLLLDLLRLPLSRLYQGLSLSDVFGPVVDRAKALLVQAERDRKPVQELIERPFSDRTQWWLVRAFPFQATNLSGVMVGLVDITKEKEQEERLVEAYQELQVQAEELRQSQETLQSAYEALEKAKEEAEARRKELEDSLIAAQRYQRTLLFRTRMLYEAWGYDHVAVVARAHTYVGGDFVVVRPKGDWLYVGVGDATGHGSSGALLAVTVQGLLHQAFLLLEDPTQLHQALEEARRELYEVLEVEPGRDLSGDGAEVALVALPLRREGSLYIATAGRPVYLLTAEGRLTEYHQGRRALGWSVPGQTPEPYSTDSLPYQPGATVFLFTDGITDQLSPEGKRLGRRTFLEWLQATASAGADPRDKMRFLLQRWHTWKGEETPQTDDVLMIAIALPKE